MNTKFRKHWWIWIFVAFYVWMIFRNSLMIASVSSGLSMRVARKLLGILNHYGFWIEFSTFHHYVRKLAHFTEFAGLGFLICLALHIAPLFRHRMINFLIFMVAVPFADETIQHFVPGRSDQFTDMLIDGAGFLAGGFVCYVIVCIIRDILHHKEEKQ